MSEKKRPGQKIKLLSVDELLCVPDGESTNEVEISKIVPFKNHPFKVLDDDSMQDLIKSIKHNGVLTPVLIRPAGVGIYEMISGHRRMHAAKTLGMVKIPAIIRELSDEDSTIIMVDANLQREELLPSEKAFAYRMKYEAVKQKIGRPIRSEKMSQVGTFSEMEKGDNKMSQLGTIYRTDIEVAKQVGESRNQFLRYIRLTWLIPELLDMVDVKRLPMISAVEISYIDEVVQRFLYEYIKENGMVKSYQVTALRSYIDQNGSINQHQMIALLNDNLPGKSKSKKVVLTEAKLKKYFSSNYTKDAMEKIVIQLLEKWKAEQDGE